MFDLTGCIYREDPAMFEGMARIFNIESEKYSRENGIEITQVIVMDEFRVHFMQHDFSNPIRPVKHQLLKAIYSADKALGASFGVTPEGEQIARPVMMDQHQKQGKYVIDLNDKLKSVVELVNSQIEKGPGGGGGSKRNNNESRAFRIRGGGIGKTKDAFLK